jgi:hypothetical protein
MRIKKKPALLVDLSVADNVHEILSPCPSVGDGVHNAILGAVSRLALLGYSPEEIPEMVEEWVRASGTTPYPREIPDALEKVFGDGDPRLGGVTHRAEERIGNADSRGARILTRGKRYERVPTWPELLYAESISIAKRRGGFDELVLSSPRPIERVQFSTEDWLDCFYKDTDLLCIGDRPFAIEVKSRSTWRGHLEHARYIVPNVFQSVYSGRCNDNVKMPRQFVLTETDIHSSVGLWEEFLRHSGADHIDVQAAILSHLKDLGILRLATVVWSGSKSMHAYWYPDPDETINRSFMETAVSLGADHHGWTKCQFARIANP